MLQSSLRLTERDATISWARDLIDDRRTVYLDTETTGLKDGSEVIDLAIVAWDGTVLIDTLVRPKRPIPPDATEIHHITDDQVRAAPPWAIVHQLLCSMIAGKRVVVYNAAYDQRIIVGCSRDVESMLMPMLPADPWECAMLAYARYRGEINPWFGDYRRHKLDQACAAFGIAAGGHRALGDARACRSVVEAMAWTG